MQDITEKFNAKLWSKLKIIFQKYADQNGQISTCLTSKISRQVLKYTDQQQINYVTDNMFRLDPDGSQSINFIEFANFILKRHCGQISLRRMHKKRLICHWDQHKIRSDQFQQLINNAISFLGVKADSNNCKLAFKVTDKDEDGLITYKQYFQFIKSHVCEKYEIKDDYWDLSIRVRNKTKELLAQFDKKKECKLQKSAIKEVLTKLLKYDQCQLESVETIAFKYDLNGDNKLSFDQFTNFIVQQHFGQFAIERLKKINGYSKVSLKAMNKKQFGNTINDGLRALGINLTQNQISKLYFSVTKYNTTQIGFDRYLTFLRKYFGTLVYNKFIEFNFSNWQLSKLARKRMRQVLSSFDKNKDKKFDIFQIQQTLIKLLNQTRQQRISVMDHKFKYDKNGDNIISFDQLANFCLEQHFGQLTLQRFHRQKVYQKCQIKLMNEKQFGLTINTFLKCLGISASPQQISLLFKQIDLQKQGWIYYQSYMLFLRYYFGAQSCIPDPTDDEEKQEKYYKNIKDELKAYFNQYDSCQKGYLSYDDLKKFARQILKNTFQQIRQFSWNDFQFDPNLDNKISFNQFAQFVIRHSGQIALQRYHRQDIPGKKFLSQKELFVILSTAFSFLKSIPKDQDISKIIYNHMGGGCQPSYVNYFDWIRLKLANKVKD